MRRYEKLTVLLASLAMASLMFASGCGGCDDDDDDVDARPPADARVDAEPTPDAEDIDAEPAPVTTHTSTDSFLDVSIIGLPQLGHGVKEFFGMQAAVDETVETGTGTLIYDGRDGLGAGCAAWVYDGSADEAPAPDEDHGTFTLENTTQDYTMTCVFVGDNYICPGGFTGGRDDLTIMPFTLPTEPPTPIPGYYIFNDADQTFTDAVIQQYINITIGNPDSDEPFDGAFAVVARPSDTSIVIFNTDTGVDPLGSNFGALDAATTYATVNAAGPVPPARSATDGSPIPQADLMEDGDTFTLSLDAPDDDPFEDFTSNAIISGSSFSLVPADQYELTHVTIPASDGTSEAFTVACDDDVASDSGAGVATIADNGTTATLTSTTSDMFANVRVGAKITISGATTNTANNGTYEIVAAGADNVEYDNADAVAETFEAGEAYVVDDCGDATLTVLNMDFNDATPLTQLGSYAFGGSGTAPQFVVSGNDVTVTVTDAFDVNYKTDYLMVTGSADGDFDGTYEVAAASKDSITFQMASPPATADFINGTALIFLEPISGLPDPDEDGMQGAIFCASLAGGTLDIPAEAVDALKEVQPQVIQSTFVRGGLDRISNEDTSNPTNVSIGHAWVGFTFPQ